MSAQVHHLDAHRGFVPDVPAQEAQNLDLSDVRLQLRATLAEQQRLNDVANECRAMADVQESAGNREAFSVGSATARAAADRLSRTINDLRTQEQQLVQAQQRIEVWA